MSEDLTKIIDNERQEFKIKNAALEKKLILKDREIEVLKFEISRVNKKRTSLEIILNENNKQFLIVSKALESASSTQKMCPYGYMCPPNFCKVECKNSSIVEDDIFKNCWIKYYINESQEMENDHTN